MYRARRLVGLAVVALAVGLLQPVGGLAQAGSRTFAETGKTVSGRFLDYWDRHGGLAQQGYPVSEELEENSDTDGRAYTVQYFERAVFESHPENRAPNDVLLSLLGVFRYKQKYPGGAPGQQANTGAGSVLFRETGKRLGGVFLEYWQSHGGLAQQGYPISEEFQEKSDLDGKTYRVQYFERAVFELHLRSSSSNRPPYNVLLSQLGTFRYKEQYVPAPRGGGSWALVYELPNMDQVRVQQDVAYKTTAGGDLKLDAYYPPDLKEGERRPAVLFAGVKDAPQWRGWGRLLAASGLVAITYDCRLPPSVTGAEALGDMTDLMAYVRGNADALHVNGDRLGVMSVSRSAKYVVSAAMRGSPGYVRIIAAYYGALDDPDAEVSPLNYLQSERGRTTPLLVVKAGRDAASVNQSIDRFVAEARARNVAVEYLVQGEGRDGFDLRDNSGRSRGIIASTLGSFKAHLLGTPQSPFGK